jgi:hypothetical protein
MRAAFNQYLILLTMEVNKYPPEEWWMDDQKEKANPLSNPWFYICYVF